jgi:hypothetical protein
VSKVQRDQKKCQETLQANTEPCNFLSILSIDIVGPIRIGQKGFFAMVVDRLTPFVLVQSYNRLQSTGSLLVVIFKIPEENKLLSISETTRHRGAQFRSHEWLDTLAKLNVRANHSSVYHPETDSLTELFA